MKNTNLEKGFLFEKDKKTDESRRFLKRFERNCKPNDSK